MAKQKTTTSRRALVAQLERAGGCTTDPARAAVAKERRIRLWAAKIVSDLPSDGDDARRVLKLAGELFRSWCSAEPATRKGGAQ
jgi:hypothetical protein